MTVATGYFDDVSESGSSTYSWIDKSNLTIGLTAYWYAPKSFVPAPDDLLFDQMGEIDALPNGTRFEEMTVTFEDRAVGWTGTCYVNWDGTIAGVSVTGTRYSHSAAGIYTSRSYGGDASYWGLDSFTGTQIFTAIRDGTLKFRYEISASGWGLDDYAYIRDVELSVTYTEADTKRAALKACVP